MFKSLNYYLCYNIKKDCINILSSYFSLLNHIIPFLVRTYSAPIYFHIENKMFTYTAKIYFDDIEINQSSGNNLDSLFIWMLTQQKGEFGNYNGQITNNKTHLIEKEFRTSSY
ncbi:hypothetical protein Lsan_1845 [Legionella santicrucis]|uniref:Uncharacterized protein n=2 Tax=Legionella santicrucis TaxID=45074 RepID=A0A0W0YWQ0_9GAMM|nr:hypothetical protein Lsan_1845 [Legionella santicrucis]